MKRARETGSSGAGGASTGEDDDQNGAVSAVSLKANQERYNSSTAGDVAVSSSAARNYQLDEVVISAGREDNFIYLWELRSGVILGSYKVSALVVFASNETIALQPSSMMRRSPCLTIGY